MIELDRQIDRSVDTGYMDLSNAIAIASSAKGELERFSFWWQRRVRTCQLVSLELQSHQPVHLPDLQAPTENTKLQQTVQSPKRLYKAPTEYTKT